MAQGPKIRFEDGDTLEFTFQYGNCRRIKSKQGSGYFWGFDCQEGSLAASTNLVNTIREYWPGRGGSLTITRHGDKHYEVVDGVKEDTSQYELEQNEWDNSAHAYVSVPWDEAAEAKTAANGKEIPPPARSNLKHEFSWQDLRYMYTAAFDMAEGVVPQAGAAAEKAVRVDVVWKMAYSVAAEAIRMGMTPTTVEQDLEEPAQPQSAEGEFVDEKQLPF